MNENKEFIAALIDIGNKSENVQIVGKTREERKEHFKKIYYGEINKNDRENSSQSNTKQLIL